VLGELEELDLAEADAALDLLKEPLVRADLAQVASEAALEPLRLLEVEPPALQVVVERSHGVLLSKPNGAMPTWGPLDLGRAELVDWQIGRVRATRSVRCRPVGAFQDAVVERVELLLSRFATAKALAMELKVTPSNVTRWRDPKDPQRPGLRTCLRIDRLLPGSHPLLTELWFADLATREELDDAYRELFSRVRVGLTRPDFVAGGGGIDRVVDGYLRAVDALEAEPSRPHPRQIRHAGFHIGDVDAIAPPAELRPVLERFGAAMTRRIEEGWDVESIYFVPSRSRLDVVWDRAHLDGFKFGLRAMRSPGLPFVAPLVVSDLVALWAYDTNAANRAGEVLEFHNRPEMVEWSLRYFETIYRFESPLLYTLRDLNGPRPDEFDRMVAEQFPES
jgi:hypothetical protein